MWSQSDQLFVSQNWIGDNVFYWSAFDDQRLHSVQSKSSRIRPRVSFLLLRFQQFSRTITCAQMPSTPSPRRTYIAFKYLHADSIHLYTYVILFHGLLTRVRAWTCIITYLMMRKREWSKWKKRKKAKIEEEMENVYSRLAHAFLMGPMCISSVQTTANDGTAQRAIFPRVRFRTALGWENLRAHAIQMRVVWTGY